MAQQKTKVRQDFGQNFERSVDDLINLEKFGLCLNFNIITKD